MENAFHAIRIAESKQDGEILQKIFESITTEQLNKYLDFDPNSILLQRVIENFDQRRRYPHLVIGLFSSILQTSIQVGLLLTMKTNEMD